MNERTVSSRGDKPGQADVLYGMVQEHVQDQDPTQAALVGKHSCCAREEPVIVQKHRVNKSSWMNL